MEKCVTVQINTSNMLSQQALSGGLAPQALGQPSMMAGGMYGRGDAVTVTVQNTPNGFRNVYSDPALHMNVLYGTNETPFRSNISCPVGSASVNNECLCPGAPSGVPYRQAVPMFTKDYMSSMFSPIEPQMFPQLSQAAAGLVAERSPCGPSAYRSMDATMLTNCSATC
jgi:hypothetical protein